MPQGVSPGFQARRALLRSLAPRYQQASPAQKTLLLDSFVEWTGYTRKYAIRFLQAGGELAALQKKLGVADIVSVKRYQHFCEQRKEEREAQACPEESMPTRQSQKGKRKRRQERRPGRGRRLSQP